MNRQDLDALLGAYALDAVDDDERREIDQYLATNPRARAEVDQYQEVAAMLAFSGSAAPDGVWDRIASVIGGESTDHVDPSPPPLQLVASDQQASSTRHSRSRRPWYALGGLAAAAAVIVAVLIGMVSHRDNELANRQALDLKSAAHAALANSNNRKVTLVSADGSQRVEVAVGSNGVGLGLVEGLPA